MSIDYVNPVVVSSRPNMDIAQDTLFTESEYSVRGIAVPFRDAFGIERQVDANTLSQLAERFSPIPPEMPIVATPGRYHPELHGLVELESGYKMFLKGTLEAGDYGYHHLIKDDGSRRLILAAPEYLPQPSRTWGWAVQLYASRTKNSWGIGDFADLASIARKAGAAGAGMVLISPVHATAVTFPQQNSPYSPSSRSWLNLQHIAIEGVPGATKTNLVDLKLSGLALNSERLIDRDAVWVLKLTALRRIWKTLNGKMPTKAVSFVERYGEDLASFALYCALSEEQGTSNWRTWDEPLQRPDTPSIMLARERLAPEIAFWSWCQWVADFQFGIACNQGVDITADLAVGFDSCGADAWVYQDTLAFDFEVGCPPDSHNREGQRWGLPPLDPDALIRMDFAPYIKMVQAGLRHAGALRIDHVMQLWRLFWVPSERSAHYGAYVHYPVDAMLAVLRIEAAKTGAWICGEDMGTVAEGVRETMESIGMLGYRASMRTSPKDNPVGSMAASSTHDQVTVVGALTGSDALDMASIGKSFDPLHAEHQRKHMCALAGISSDTPVEEITQKDIEQAVLSQYQGVAHSASLIAVVTLDDAGGIAQRPNMPGTIDQWANWRLSLPVDEILEGPIAQRLTLLMKEANR